MMLYPPVAELAKKAGSRYQLVNLVARRARAIAEEAEANNCVLLDKAGSVSAILVNGSKRNTQVAVRKALRVKGATHVGYTKGKPGTTNVRMFVWSCPNPNLKTSDPQVAEWQRDYLGHD